MIPLWSCLHANQSNGNITGGNQQGGSPAEDKHLQVEDKQLVGNLGSVVVGSRRVAHMLVAVGIQLMAELTDPFATFVEEEELPSRAVVRICHLFCPFQPYAVSALLHSSNLLKMREKRAPCSKSPVKQVKESPLRKYDRA